MLKSHLTAFNLRVERHAWYWQTILPSANLRRRNCAEVRKTIAALLKQPRKESSLLTRAGMSPSQMHALQKFLVMIKKKCWACISTSLSFLMKTEPITKSEKDCENRGLLAHAKESIERKMVYQFGCSSPSLQSFNRKSLPVHLSWLQTLLSANRQRKNYAL